ncbi:hypothetical protein OFAG_02237 [Oxalobacter formigenes HOxBLS]|uniref:Uncharacterized protein n=1 Tax=Oxalobacter paraformigenes TaxID=556268 RepID=T5LPR3_9BURK|nr:hypothetical protein OFAG_02237 [Oxalobacter paraformigenes]
MRPLSGAFCPPETAAVPGRPRRLPDGAGKRAGLPQRAGTAVFDSRLFSPAGKAGRLPGRLKRRFPCFPALLEPPGFAGVPDEWRKGANGAGLFHARRRGRKRQTTFSGGSVGSGRPAKADRKGKAGMRLAAVPAAMFRFAAASVRQTGFYDRRQGGKESAARGKRDREKTTR